MFLQCVTTCPYIMCQNILHFSALTPSLQTTTVATFKYAYGFILDNSFCIYGR